MNVSNLGKQKYNLDYIKYGLLVQKTSRVLWRQRFNKDLEIKTSHKDIFRVTSDCLCYFKFVWVFFFVFSV